MFAESVVKNISKVFETVYFLPGVEYTTQDQIHMLVIFNKDINLDLVEQFLYRGGCNPENQGDEKTKKLSNWTVIDLFDEATHDFKNDAIIIGAHVDRKKGVWESLDGSEYRASILRSEKLLGISYNTPSTRDAIKKIMKHKEYRRDNAVEPAFFQCSDFHNESGQKIGEPRAFIKMDGIDFKNLVNAFSNPNESIFSPAPPETQSIIEELASNLNNIGVPNIDTKDCIDKIKMSICAFTNSNNGSIVVGINEYRQPNGIQNNNEEIKTVMEEVIDLVNPRPKVEYQIYEYGKRKVISIRVKKGIENLYWCDDKIYLHKQNEIVEAKPKDISVLVENNIIDRYKSILEINRKRLNNISDMISSYSDGLETMQYMNFIENDTVYLRDVVEIKLAKYPKEHLKEEISHKLKQNGNIIVLDKRQPRTKTTVSCFLAPIKFIAESSLENIGLIKFNGEKVIVNNSGAVHYNDTDDIFILPDGRASIVLTIQEKYKEMSSLKFLTAYLKSNVFLYHTYLHNDSINIFSPKCFNTLRVPINIQYEKRKAVEEQVDKIIKKENEFLAKAEKICMECDDNNKADLCKVLQSEAKFHNDLVSKEMEEIDNIIYSIFGFDDAIIINIEKTLNKILPTKL